MSGQLQNNLGSKHSSKNYKQYFASSFSRGLHMVANSIKCMVNMYTRHKALTTQSAMSDLPLRGPTVNTCKGYHGNQQNSITDLES